MCCVLCGVVFCCLICSVLLLELCGMLCGVFEFVFYYVLGGGVLFGLVVIGKFVFIGCVFGVSGVFKGFVWGDCVLWCVVFVGGLFVVGVCVCEFGVLDVSVLMVMVSGVCVVCVGVLVGVGMVMGWGCTSGYGIVGNSWLSARSAAYMVMFMLVGVVMVMMFDMNEVLGVDLM